MSETRLRPKIRFEEFNEEWIVRRLKDFRDDNFRYSYTGGPFGSDLRSEDYTKNGVRIIQLQNIGEGKFIDDYKIYTSELKAETLSSNLIYPNDIIIAKMAEPLARAAIIPENHAKYLMSSDGIRLKIDTKKYHTYFLLTLINDLRFRRKALENSTGTTRKRIGLVTLGNLSSYVPNYKEQQKIGNFFKHLDQMIYLEQRKLEKTKALKSAYLAEMFPAEGERVPKRRFSGFTGEWEEKKIGELGSVAMNKRIFKAQTTAEGDVPFYKIGTFGNKADAFISQELFEEYKAKYLYPEFGDILISASGSIGRTVEYLGKDEYFQDSNIVWLKHDGKLNNSFLKQFYKIVSWEGLEGSTIKRLYNKNILETRINIPSLKEQQKIGQFFNKLDESLTNQQQKLDKLKAMKQAYLEEMFV